MLRISKNSIILLFPLLILFCTCKKEKSNTGNSYSPTSMGSSWNYKGFITVSTRNIMTGRTFKKFGKTYYEKAVTTDKETINFYGTHTDDDYYTIVTDPMNNNAENEVLYLKTNASVGDSWVVEIKYGFDILGNQWKYKILEKGIAKIVNGKTYSNVIHTERDSDGKIIHSYYCLGVGLIEVAYDSGANSTLESYNIE